MHFTGSKCSSFSIPLYWTNQWTHTNAGTPEISTVTSRRYIEMSQKSVLNWILNSVHHIPGNHIRWQYQKENNVSTSFLIPKDAVTPTWAFWIVLPVINSNDLIQSCYNQ